MRCFDVFRPLKTICNNMKYKLGKIRGGLAGRATGRSPGGPFQKYKKLLFEF